MRIRQSSDFEAGGGRRAVSEFQPSGRSPVAAAAAVVVVVKGIESGGPLEARLCQCSAVRLSFYSGHSSFGMYCMLFLALYVHARLVAKWARLLRPTIQFFLISFALYVAYTRVSDYMHHWSDVLVGLLQGALIATLNVRYVSDFFKRRLPRVQRRPQQDELECKPSLHAADLERNSHYSLPGAT
ncbi:UNVERIFIED_CONTAM: hypothetical protein FKN15_000841 [Acipenser sinensis]